MNICSDKERRYENLEISGCKVVLFETSHLIVLTG